ncbi:MAG: hypothetical protein JKY37_27980, partial [Nannocystaceae bacterium]|nr:hypothetical protein [Nannocystaceae bacterium]
MSSHVELLNALPLGFVSLSEHLSDERQLMATVATREHLTTQRGDVSASELRGRCDGATHVVIGARLGAFELVGVPIRAAPLSLDEELALALNPAATDRRMLRSSGNLDSCAIDDATDCHAVIALELSKIEPLSQCASRGHFDAEKATCLPEGDCPEQMMWDGLLKECRPSSPHCSAGELWWNGQCTAAPTIASQVSTTTRAPKFGNCGRNPDVCLDTSWLCEAGPALLSTPNAHKQVEVEHLVRALHEHARALLRNRCGTGHPDACYRLGELDLVEVGCAGEATHHEGSAVSAFIMACDFGSA